MLALADKRPNVGAIKLFHGFEENCDALLTVLEHRWDVPVEYRKIRPLYRRLRAAGPPFVRRLSVAHGANTPPGERWRLILEKTKDAVWPLLGRAA